MKLEEFIEHLITTDFRNGKKYNVKIKIEGRELEPKNITHTDEDVIIKALEYGL